MSDLWADRRQPENNSERREVENMTAEDAPIRKWLQLGRRALNYFSRTDTMANPAEDDESKRHD